MQRIGFLVFVLFAYLSATATLARAQYAGETTQALNYLATSQAPTAPAMQIVAGDDLYVIVSWAGTNLNDVTGVLDNPGGHPLTRESGACDSHSGTCIARYRITESSLITVHATLLINNATVASFFAYVKECLTQTV
jgi:hypothetical protein